MGRREDVAKLAGVSPRTVSNVVSGSVTVAPSTRDRVLRAIEELDYQPSEIGRMLREGRTGVLALVVPELSSPYFAELSQSLASAARERGYTLVVEQTGGLREREREMLDRAGTKAVFDGLLVNPLGLTDDDLSAPSRQRRPVVLLGEETHRGFDHVLIDNFAAAREAVEHLIRTGRRRIAAVGAQRGQHSSSTLRLAGFERAISGSDAVGLVEHVDDFSPQNGVEATRRLLASGERPDALFCFSDWLAIGALAELSDAGLSVPSDVAVVGFNDTVESRFIRPALTSISPDKEAIAEAAIDAIVRRIGGDDSPRGPIVVRHSLQVRASTAG